MLIIGKNILVLGEGQTQGLNDASITAEAKYSSNFSRSQKIKFVSLHYNRSNILHQSNLRKSHATSLNSMNKIPFIW